MPSAELDELNDLEQQSGRRTHTLAELLTRCLALPSGELPNELHGLARAALRAHEHEGPAVTEALAVDPEPVVSWWCEQCGGLDAPAPCVGVCIRRPAQWATLDLLQRQRAGAADALQSERRLALAVRALVLTRARPGSELRHWRALRQTAERALAGRPQRPAD